MFKASRVGLSIKLVEPVAKPRPSGHQPLMQETSSISTSETMFFGTCSHQSVALSHMISSCWEII